MDGEQLGHLTIRLAQDKPETNILEANLLVCRKGFSSRLWSALDQAYVILTKRR